MKRLGVFLLPRGWDASPSQGYPPALRSTVPIYTPGWREALWKYSVLPNKTVQCLRNGTSSDHSIWSRSKKSSKKQCPIYTDSNREKRQDQPHIPYLPRQFHPPSLSWVWFLWPLSSIPTQQPRTWAIQLLPCWYLSSPLQWYSVLSACRDSDEPEKIRQH